MKQLTFTKTEIRQHLKTATISIGFEGNFWDNKRLEVDLKGRYIFTRIIRGRKVKNIRSKNLDRILLLFNHSRLR